MFNKYLKRILHIRIKTKYLIVNQIYDSDYYFVLVIILYKHLNTWVMTLYIINIDYNITD